YDDVSPSGPSDGAQVIPFWWTRRGNVLKVETFPRAGVPTRVAESTNPGELKPVAAQVTEMVYEPLFNQVAAVHAYTRTSAEEDRTSGVNLVSTYYDFDYQEFDPESEEFKEVLKHFTRFGFPSWYVFSDSAPASVVAKLLRVPFYGSNGAGANLNGDTGATYASGESPQASGSEIIGFPVFGDDLDRRARGAVVRTRIERDGKAKFFYTQPGSTGRPRSLADDSGHGVRIEYYSASTSATEAQRFGVHLADLDQHSGSGRSGLLAKISVLRAKNASSSSSCFAPFDDALSTLGLSCANHNDARSFLTGTLGLTTDMADAMLVPADPEDQFTETAYTYSPTGYTASEHSTSMQSSSQAGGKHITFQRDHRGMPLSTEDHLGNLVQNEYDWRRRLIRQRVVDVMGSTLSDARFQYDDDGNLLAECHDVTGSDCASLLGNGVVAFDAARPSVHAAQTPGYLLTTYRYTPKGALRKVMTPAGVTITYDRDERGFVVRETTSAVGESARVKRMWYDTWGNITRVGYDDPALLGELFTYDGLDQLVEHRDLTNVYHSYARDTRGRVVAVRSAGSSSPFGSSITTSADPDVSETILTRDELGRVVRVERGFQETNPADPGASSAFAWTEFAYDGASMQPSRMSREDGSVLKMGYDASGALRYTEDALGNITLSASSPRERIDYQATVRKHPDTGEFKTTVVRSEGRLALADTMNTSVFAWDNGALLEERTQVTLDGLGRPLKIVAPDDSISERTYNMAGWVTSSKTSPDFSSSAATDSTAYTYNAFGAVTRLEDSSIPAQVTRYEYTGYGELAKRFYPADPAHA
ncbi:MAG: hypothetical protein AAGI01_14450, partial [Myxococcota bacterium]